MNALKRRLTASAGHRFDSGTALWELLAMRYRLRTLLIVLALGPAVLAGGWSKYAAWKAEQERQRAAEAERAAAFSFYIGITR
jgi:hypothetical protein